jgi:hypothetical protein
MFGFSALADIAETAGTYSGPQHVEKEHKLFR